MRTTKCTVCGAPVEYKTKPPKKCAACKEAAKLVKKPRKKSKSTRNSSKEVKMFRELDGLLPGQYYVRNGYYSFLMSPKHTPMQLDIYYPDLKLAFEYDGRQHAEFNKYFFKSKKQFQYLQRCDKLKDKLCAQLNITLIRISHDKKITPQLLTKKIEETGRDDVIRLIKEANK